MPLADDILARVARRLGDHAGLELPAWVVEARAEARLDALGLEPDAYCELIESGRGAAELELLVESVRVGETSMFRHAAQFRTVVDVIAPQLQARGRRVVQAWSAGCANGCEPYSLAIALARALPDVVIQIVATDLSEPALAAARANQYPRAVLADVPPEYLDAFEAIDDELVAVAPAYAQLVRFDRGNLADPRRGDTEHGRFDLVWCRNVLIYFAPDARRRAVERLIASTTFGGAIFVGYSESLRDVAGLDAARSGETVYYVRRPPAAADVPRPRSRTEPHGVPIARATPPAGIAAVAVPHKPPSSPGIQVPPAPPIARAEVVVLSGQPDAGALTSELAARLGGAARVVVVELDGCELLDDTLAPVLRRATAAARAAGGELVLRANRTGQKRWLARHGLPRATDGDEP